MPEKDKDNKKETIEDVKDALAEGEQMSIEEMKTENQEQAEAEAELLKKQLEDAETKAAENMDGWQRSQAEFINYKNRVQRDRESDYSAMKGEILKNVLPVLDDLELALANRPEKDSWADGMELIARKFKNVLEAEGLTRIEAEGQLFDPNFHEAISSEPNDDVESEHVIEVVQNGYMLGERVIRPAMVRVSK